MYILFTLLCAVPNSFGKYDLFWRTWSAPVSIFSDQQRGQTFYGFSMNIGDVVTDNFVSVSSIRLGWKGLEIY